MTKPQILAFDSYDDWDLEPMRAAYSVHAMPDHGTLDDLSAEIIESVEAFAFKGHSTLNADFIDAFPKLRMIANFGVGYDTIDVAHAHSKDIKVSNTPDVLTNDVADLAVGMVIAQSRGMLGASNWIRSGHWASKGNFRLQRSVSGKRVGIVGLGRIGRAIAERLEPFGMQISYFSRSAKPTPAWVYCDDIVAMAGSVDILVVAVSGGSATRGIVGRQAIEALGPNGLLVNISRGSTMDQDALLDALEQGTLGAAALDVFDNEPNVDSRFLALDNVLLQPHQSSATVETRKLMGQLQRDNLAAFFAGRPLLTEVV